MKPRNKKTKTNTFTIPGASFRISDKEARQIRTLEREIVNAYRNRNTPTP